MKIKCPIRQTILIFANIIMSVVFTASAIRGGTAYTASGVPIPDSGLIIPFFIFIIFSAIQFALLQKNKNLYAVTVNVLCFFIFGAVVYLLCGYSLTNDFMNSNRNGAFGDNIVYSCFVIIFIIVAVLSFLAETVLSVLEMKRKKQNAQTREYENR